MQQTERYTGKAALCAAFLLLFTGFPATAGASISVSPVLLELDQQHSKDIVRVANVSEVTKSFEVNVVAWTQSDQDREIYADTGDLIAVPPLFTLAPGEEQIVRVGLMRAPDADNELAYRVFFTELAPPELEQPTASGISMRLRFGVPAFVAPLAEPAPGIEFTGVQRIDGNVFLGLGNNGNVRVKITEIRFRPPMAENSDSKSAVFYLHPGKSGMLPLTFDDLDMGGTVELETDTAGVLSYVLAGTR